MFTLEKSALCKLLAASVILCAASGTAEIIHVSGSAEGADSGVSWEDAFTDLGAALESAVAGDEIWLAAGTYRGHFRLPPGVAVHGGFQGLETDLAARDDNPFTNGTVLSGDILNNDDSPCAGNESWNDNVETVVSVGPGQERSTLTGVTIVRAKNWGINVESGVLTLKKSRITDMGPEVFLWDAAAINAMDSHLTVEDVLIASDICQLPVFASRSTVFLNRTTLDFAHLHCCSVVATKSNFRRGTTQFLLSRAVLMDSYFATRLFLEESVPSALIIGCTFANVDATHGILLVGRQFFVAHSLFYHNSGGSAGALSLRGSSSTSIEACSFIGNTASKGSAVNGNLRDRTVISNSLFWANSQSLPFRPQIDVSSSPDIQNTLIDGSGGSGSTWDRNFGDDLGGNIDSDPEFGPLMENTSSWLASLVPGAGSAAATNAGARLPVPELPDLCMAPTEESLCTCDICESPEEGEFNEGEFKGGYLLPPVPPRPDCDLSEIQAMVEARLERDLQGNPRPTSGGKIGALETFSHSADVNANHRLDVGELLRVVQFYNAGAYHCAGGTEDGFAPGREFTLCDTHSSDYNPQDWRIDLNELLRAIQFYNTGGYTHCPDAGTEDGFCPGGPGL